MKAGAIGMGVDIVVLDVGWSSMGFLKDKLIEQVERSEQAILDLPDTLEESHARIRVLGEKVGELEIAVSRLNSPWEKYKGYFIGAIIGFLISFMLSWIVGLL